MRGNSWLVEELLAPWNCYNNNNNNNNAIFPEYIDGSRTISRPLIISVNNIKRFALVTVTLCVYCEEDVRFEVSHTLRMFQLFRTAPTLWRIIHGRKVHGCDLKRALVTVSYHTAGTDGFLWSSFNACTAQKHVWFRSPAYSYPCPHLTYPQAIGLEHVGSSVTL